MVAERIGQSFAFFFLFSFFSFCLSFLFFPLFFPFFVLPFVHHFFLLCSFFIILLTPPPPSPSAYWRVGMIASHDHQTLPCCRSPSGSQYGAIADDGLPVWRRLTPHWYPLHSHGTAWRVKATGGDQTLERTDLPRTRLPPPQPARGFIRALAQAR